MQEAFTMSRVSLSDVKKFNNESNLLFGRREMYQAFGGHQVNDRAGHSAAGYFSMRQSKLERQFAEAAKDEDEERQENSGQGGKGNRKGILTGVVAYVNGYTGPDASDLEMRQLIVSHGGAFRQFFSISRATHIIAPSMSKSKIQQLLTTKSSSRRIAPIVHVVRPEWVLDSIAAGKKLNVDKYLLFRDATISKLPVKTGQVEPDEANELAPLASVDSLPTSGSMANQGVQAILPPAKRLSFFATIRKHQKAAPLTQQR